MTRLEYGRGFLKRAQSLSATEQQKLALLLECLANNPFDARLKSKKLSGNLAGFFSFRVGREWRVLFQFLDPRCIKLIDVAQCKDIYRQV